MHSSNIGLFFYGYASEMFPPIDPVRPELINLGAIFEELFKLLYFLKLSDMNLMPILIPIPICYNSHSY